MELGIVIDELNRHVSTMDAYNYNVSITVGPNVVDRGYSLTIADADRPVKRRLSAYDDAFVRPPPPLFIEPVLTSPDDYAYPSPKRVKPDEERYVRAAVPSIVRDTPLRKPTNAPVPPVPPPPPPPPLANESTREGGVKPVVRSVRDELLNSIRKGVALRPVGERRSVAPNASVMAAAMATRRAAISPLETVRDRMTKIMELTPGKSEPDEEEDAYDDDDDDGSLLEDETS